MAPTEWSWNVFSTSQISITANVPQVPRALIFREFSITMHMHVLITLEIKESLYNRFQNTANSYMHIMTKPRGPVKFQQSSEAFHIHAL